MRADEFVPRITRHGGRSPVLSIITVVYRDPEGLARTMKSLPAEADDVELVIVDGARRPAEASTVGVPLGGLDATVVEGADSGPYDAMNRGIMASSGTWVWFVNAGDEVHASCDVATLVRDLRAITSHWAVGDVEFVSEDRTEVSPAVADPEATLRGTGYQCHQGAIVRRSAILATGLFHTRFQVCADYRMLCAVARMGPPANLSRILASFYTGGISSQRRSRLHLENWAARATTSGNGVVFTTVDAARAARRAWRARRE